MSLSADDLRLLLSLGLLGMMFLSAFYLRSRKLTLAQFLGWGMLVVLVPLLGPFLAIISHPGESNR